MSNTGVRLVKTAKKEKHFNNHSGNAENSITFDMVVDGHVRKLVFFSDPTRTTLKSGESYFVYLHEGTMKGYDQSSFAPKFSPRSNGKGIKADHFMVRSWKKETPKLIKELESNVSKARKRAGL